MEEKSWKQFMKTGYVSDYLDYKNTVDKEIEQPREDNRYERENSMERDHTFQHASW